MSHSQARQILGARLASGQVSEEEYERIRARLDPGDTGHDPAGPGQGPPPLREPEPEAAPGGKEPPKKKRFYLRRLWRGELSLPTTYWLWGVLGSVVIGLISAALMNAAVTMAEVAIPALLVLIWSVFITVSIFRSGAAYCRRNPRKPWGRAAQGVACLSLLATIGNVGRSLPGNEPDSDLDAAIADANRGGPHMIGNNVRFDQVSRDGRTFVYTFTITGPSHAPPREAVTKLRSQSVQQLCNDADLKRLLLSIDKATYRYVDDGGQLLMSYDVRRANCL